LLTAPEVRDGIVPRDDLVEELRDARHVPVVLVVAGAGYGKTTLLAQWTNADDRPFVWLSITELDNDPAIFVARLASALDSIESLDHGVLARLTSSGPDLTSVQLSRLATVLEGRAHPFVLVLDDVHRLSARGALVALRVVCDSIPEGSQVALGAREEPDLSLGARRALRALVVIDRHKLAMTADEGNVLMRGAGLELDRDHAELIVERTEGWPAALYLASLAIREQDDPAAAARRFAGDDRHVVDYLRDELFATMDDETAEFLTRTSILDRLSGPLCDAALDRSGSVDMLERLERSNLLILPLDRTREWFRYHQLFRERLRARLHRLEPELEVGLHARASAWYEAHGDADEAIVHAAAAGDTGRFDALVWKVAAFLISSGKADTVMSWLRLVTPEEVAARPALVVTAAWCALGSGDPAGLEHWASVAAHVTPEADLPDGTPFAAAVALLRAAVGKEGVVRLGEDAAFAYARDRQGSPFRPVASQLEGAALRLRGRLDDARIRLEEGAAVGRLLNPASQAHCLAQLALIDIDAAAWDDAQRRVEDALVLIEGFGLTERPPQAATYAVAALVHAHQGRSDDARRELKHSLWLLSMLAAVGPWLAVESRVLLARGALLLGDVAMARMLCKEAESLVARMSDAGELPERLARVQRMADAESVGLGVAVSPMTPAEMRVLRYLPTHLTFGAIADELFVSRNTVKTQAISIYRKLGVSSRAPAVAAAQELGLLDE
jgi:LuxR family transcriptional regulator, maltose regulon positive regulatory protein